MGSLIKLALGNLEVDWGKNETFEDHRPLFQHGDLGEADYVYYAYQNGSHERFSEKRAVLSKPLRFVLPRLGLLGHALESVAREYESLREAFHRGAWLSFESLTEAVRQAEPRTVSREYPEDGYDLGEFFLEEIVPRLSLTVPPDDPAERRYFGEMMENFHPWSILRLLAEKPANLDLPVTWYFADVVEGGWAESHSFVPGALPQSHLFLLVTEGSSDSKILRKAFDLLTPEIRDFFRFVDMEEGYPFTGTGNLHNFCKGLVSIGILNKMLVIFDNDAEGVYKANQVSSLKRPSNMGVMRLPDLPEFEQFDTLGPNGRSKENINGCAASIEAYLDLGWQGRSAPVVRWSAYHEKLKCYQGMLIAKEDYTHDFLGLRTSDPHYNFGKLQILLRRIIEECTSIANN